MKRKNVTRNALFTSIISLLLCVSMLVGTTFAWFTDSVTSAGNIIKSGNLDVAMYWADGKEDPAAVTWTDASTGAIFNYDLWEPGYTEVRHIKIANEGSLALKYQLQIKANGAVSDLADVIDVYFIDPATQVASRTALSDANKVGTLSEILAGMPQNASGSLAADKEAVVTLALKMQEEAGNAYMNKQIGTDFSVVLYATQVEAESDSFGKDYDTEAGMPNYGQGNTNGTTGTDIKIYDDDGAKVASVSIPTEAVAEDTNPVAYVKKTESNFVVQAGQEKQGFDITVLGLKENNDVEITVTLNMPAGLDPKTVSLYHYDTKIPCTYNPTTGLVSFTSTSFSPFTVVYDAESVYVPPVIEDPEEKLPKATVVKSDEYENVDLPWGSYGQWSPTEGLDSKLEAAYTFSCAETLEEAQKNPYAYWYCDFFVKLDKDLGANQIFLGGNYGSFGWVGFHNGELTLPANEEIPLLGSVTSSPWTYLDVVQNVGTFICGVGDVDDALAGATFTVMLRLTNPENADEFYNVATINYTFEDTTIDTEAELVKALADGEKEIEIEGNITLTKSLGATDVTLIGACEDAGINFNGYNIGGSGAITYKNLNLSTIALGADAGERGGWYGGIDYNGHSVANYENCTITGVFTTYSKTVNATNCTFNSYVQDGEEYYNIFLYSSGTVNATNCTFMYRDRGIKIYSEGPNTFALNIDGGQFVATDDYTANKPLVNVDSTYFESATIAVKNVEIDEKLESVSLHNAEGNSKVTVTVQ